MGYFGQNAMGGPVFTLNVDYIQLNYDSIYHTLFNYIQLYGSVHIGEDSNKLGRVTIEATTTVGLEVGFQPRRRSIGSNISHSCRWFPEILLPSRILRYFCLRLLILTRHCCALLEYPPWATPWLILPQTSFVVVHGVSLMLHHLVESEAR